ncbi:MAG: hypothetical protein II038_14125 [Lachnospiraceae bacterium]|nr:hypothetical protein [Lachnospiraceae bacterium]
MTKKIPKLCLRVLYVFIAIIALKILGNVENGNFHAVYAVLPAFVGLCVGTHILRKHLNQREVEEIIAIAYARARAEHITYASENDILRECLTKRERQRLRTLLGEYPYEAN